VLVCLLCSVGHALADADFTRLDTWVGHGIRQLDLAFEDGPRCVVAVERTDGQLKLFSFSTANGALSKLDDLLVPTVVSQVKITHVASGTRDYFIVVSRHQSGYLQLQTFELMNDGRIVTRDYALDTLVTNNLAVAAHDLDHHYASLDFVVAARMANNKLLLRGYELGSDGTLIQKFDDSGYFDVERVALQIYPVTGLWPGMNVLVASQAPGTGQLELRAWQWTYELNYLTDSMESNVSVGTVSGLGMPGVADDSQLLTAVRDAAGKLKLIRWKVALSPAEIRRREDGQAGQAGIVRIAVAPNVSNRYLSAHESGNGDLRLIVWRRADGEIQKVGSNESSGEDLGTAKKIALGFAKSGRAVSAVRDGSDRLRLVLWHIAW
jgi:hypothetical protein